MCSFTAYRRESELALTLQIFNPARHKITLVLSPGLDELETKHHHSHDDGTFRGSDLLTTGALSCSEIIRTLSGSKVMLLVGRTDARLAPVSHCIIQICRVPISSPPSSSITTPVSVDPPELGNRFGQAPVNSHTNLQRFLECPRTACAQLVLNTTCRRSSLS